MFWSHWFEEPKWEIGLPELLLFLTAAFIIFVRAVVSRVCDSTLWQKPSSVYMSTCAATSVDSFSFNAVVYTFATVVGAFCFQIVPLDLQWAMSRSFVAICSHALLSSFVEMLYLCYLYIHECISSKHNTTFRCDRETTQL